MTVVLKVLDRNAPTLKQTLVMETEKLSQEAEFARSLIHSWGMIGREDGETSAGHCKVRMLTEKELVQRAVTTTHLAMQAFRDNGWVIQCPTIEEITAEDPPKTGFWSQNGVFK